MSECCTKDRTDSRSGKKHLCPENGKGYSSVAIGTITHHISKPWNWDGAGRSYYFCEDPDCDVVYFADDDSIITRSSLRTDIGIKNRSDESLVCYCFGVSRAEAVMPETRAFVVEQTKNKQCSCDTRNPSGRCCLKDFPKT